jgi:carbonic anhydrase
LELDAIRVSLNNLRSFPFIAEREQQGELKLHGAYFGIADGDLQVLDESSGQYHSAN